MHHRLPVPVSLHSAPLLGLLQSHLVQLFDFPFLSAAVKALCCAVAVGFHWSLHVAYWRCACVTCCWGFLCLLMFVAWCPRPPTRTGLVGVGQCLLVLTGLPITTLGFADWGLAWHWLTFKNTGIHSQPSCWLLTHIINGP